MKKKATLFSSSQIGLHRCRSTFAEENCPFLAFPCDSDRAPLEVHIFDLNPHKLCNSTPVAYNSSMTALSRSLAAERISCATFK